MIEQLFEVMFHVMYTIGGYCSLHPEGRKELDKAFNELPVGTLRELKLIPSETIKHDYQEYALTKLRSMIGEKLTEDFLIIEEDVNIIAELVSMKKDTPAIHKYLTKLDRSGKLDKDDYLMHRLVYLIDIVKASKELIRLINLWPIREEKPEPKELEMRHLHRKLKASNKRVKKLTEELAAAKRNNVKIKNKIKELNQET